jgi:hypothetical protein
MKYLFIATIIFIGGCIAFGYLVSKWMGVSWGIGILYVIAADYSVSRIVNVLK